MPEKEQQPSLEELSQRLHRISVSLDRIETIIFPSLDWRQAKLDLSDKHFAHIACQLGLARVALLWKTLPELYKSKNNLLRDIKQRVGTKEFDDTFAKIA